uniref:Cofac_haem_bdg domain-containing protein n=1 Tax=Steinernema glaseri TaxID=37863 RepID=A0A1I7YRC3_9BILA
MPRTLLFGTLLLLALGLSACQSGAALAPLPQWQGPQGRDHAELGQIRELSTGRLLTPEQLARRLAAAPRVLVGEQHDNPDHHALQLWLLRALEQQRPQGSLLLEMLEPAQQARVDALKQQPTLPVDLVSALHWQSGWDWALYGPIVRHALGRPYPLLAANLDRAEVRDIYRQVPKLEGQHATTAAVTQALLDQ